MLKTNYNEEFCMANDFNGDFFLALMEAGFLIMSMELKEPEAGGEKNIDGQGGRFFLLLPKLHLTRSVLFFSDLRIKKRIRPLLSRYELRTDTDFDLILDKCIQKHGDAWLTPPLVENLKNMHRDSTQKQKGARPFSFALYRNGELKAGEFGVVVGRVYTSYSGYYEEDNAGTVQIILMAQWMEKSGFDFLDLGMPMDYKSSLGAQNIEPQHFVELFRKARGPLHNES